MASRRPQPQESIWNIDLVALFKSWIDDMATFLLTALTFFGLALPVIIPILVLWFLVSIGFRGQGGMTLPP